MALATLLLLLSSAAPVEPARPPAIEALASRVAAALAAQGYEAPCTLRVDAEKAALAQALIAALAPALRPVAEQNPDARSAVRLSVTLEGNALVARGSWTSTWVNFWAGASPPTRPARALPELRVDADAQALALATGQLTAVPLPAASGPLALELTQLAQLAEVPVAVACGDHDGDGKGEIAVLLPGAVLLLSPEGRALARFDLGPPSPAVQPSREPFGAIAVLDDEAAARGVLYVSSRHAEAQVLRLERGELRKTGALPDRSFSVESLSLELAPGLNFFSAQARLSGKPLSLPAPAQSVSFRRGVRLLQLAGGGVAVSRTGQVPAPATGAGAAAALADLNADGTPEVLITSAEPFPAADLASVLSLAEVEAAQAKRTSLGSVAPLWRGPLSRGRALTAAGCDLDADGRDEVVIGAWLPEGAGELWLLGPRKP